jgi:uncharacterized protein YbbC (DUF1343 family)
VHGLTVGELARMINGKHWMAAQCDLTVVQMHGWSRRMTWADTGLRWIPSSPNIPRGSSALYYIATGLVGELSGPETGIGGPAPFQSIAGSWLDAASFTQYLRRQETPGVLFAPFHSGRLQGARLTIEPDSPTNLTGLGIYMLAEMNQAGRKDLFERTSASKLDIFYKVCGGTAIRAQIESGKRPPDIIASWLPNERAFRAARAPYLLY